MSVSRSVTRHLLAAVTAVTLFSPQTGGAKTTGVPSPDIVQQPGPAQDITVPLPTGVGRPDPSGMVPVGRIRAGKARRLKEIAAMVQQQRRAAADFEGFVSWMNSNLAGYNRYLQAGSYAATAAKFLPVPYAGQASVFTRFVARFTLALNEASTAVTVYLDTSRRFMEMADTLDASNIESVAGVAELAEGGLVRDMSAVQSKLVTIADLSTGTLSFLESLNHFAGSTDEYWNKAKGIFKKDIDPRDRSFLSENIAALKSQAEHLHAGLKSYDESVRKASAWISGLRIYDELIQEAASASPERLGEIL